MNTVILIISSIVFLRGLTTLIFLMNSLNWLKKNNRQDLELSKLTKKPKIHILIPALREQKRIIETIKYFLKYILSSRNIDLTIVTTQREFEKPFDGLSTYELVKDFIKTNKLSNVFVLDSQYKTGIKAHQLNYALQNITDGYITVYDADSRPHPNTLRAFFNEKGKYPNAKVFQQSAVFFNNFKSLKTSFLKSSAVLQTRWTLAHEIPRLLRQSFLNNKFLQKYAYAHVVGHGLIIDIGVLKSVGGFPSKTITEDLFLGYLLRTKGYAIYPLFLIEFADAPATIKGLWNQKYVWFFGPLKTITYLKFTLKKKIELQIKSTVIPYVMTMQGIVSALAWLLSGLFILILVLSPLFVSSPSLILFAFISVLIYGPIQYFITLVNYSHLIRYAGVKESRLTSLEICKSIFMCLPAIVFNSIPPYFALVTNMRSLFNKKDVYKPKTDD